MTHPIDNAALEGSSCFSASQLVCMGGNVRQVKTKLVSVGQVINLLTNLREWAHHSVTFIRDSSGKGLRMKRQSSSLIAHLLSNSLALRKYMMVGSKLPTWRASSPTWASAPKCMCMLMYQSSLIGLSEYKYPALGKFSSEYLFLSLRAEQIGVSS